MRFQDTFAWILADLTRRPVAGGGSSGFEPKFAVWGALALAIVVGGGLKLWRGWKARRAIAKLAEPKPTRDQILDAASHGRESLVELFRIQGTADDPSARLAAGEALTILWAGDQLIAEEEKAIVRRGFEVVWKARKRYPRGLRGAIPIEATFGVPFLREEPGRVGPSRLEWSRRIVGAERASLEEFGPWTAGPARVAFAVEPRDFATDGPHRLVLQVRARTVGLTDRWELELPHVAFSFEFDPILRVDALLAQADLETAEAVARAARFEVVAEHSHESSRILSLNDEFVLRDPPALVFEGPPRDLSHAIFLEFEGVEGRFASGFLQMRAGTRCVVPLQRPAGFPLGAIDRPGAVRMRALLVADVERAWHDPDLRSVWPEVIEIGWTEAKVVRK